MIQASCCCGEIRFALTEPPTMMGACHCSRCRKLGAGVFVFVRRETLQWISGQDAVARYEPAAPFTYARCFCRVCGTSLGEIDSPADAFPISAHCFDDDPQVRIRFHEFTADKPAWYEICDDAKQFPGHPPRSS